MLTVSAYGRLGADPVERTTKAGKLMVTASMVVDVTPFGAESESSVWVGLVAFGQVAESLARHAKADMLGCIGKLSLRKWRDKDGNDRESWSLLVEALHSSRTVRPGGGAKRKSAQQATKAPEPHPSAPQGDSSRPFNDEIPF